MTDWIPLLQALVWPVFLGCLLFWLRGAIWPIIVAVRSRIEQGDTFEATTTGFKIEKGERARQLVAEGLDPTKPPQLPNTIYLVHEQTSKKPTKNTSGTEYYSVRIFLDADEPDLLADVEKVVYHLHHTFRPPVVVKTNKAEAFELVTNIWGEFNMYAEVHFRNRQEPLLIERYINL